VIAGVTLGLGVCIGIATGATASVSAKKLCEVLERGSALPDVSTQDATQGQARNAAKRYKRLSKADAPKKVKKALKTIARTFERIADGDDAEDVLGDADAIRRYVDAISTFSEYQLDNCTGGFDPPPVTLPD
jgi:hypothetical protein